MHRRVKHFIRNVSEMPNLPVPIYEFGSRRMVGQEESANVRHMFNNDSYVGADYIDGLGVDVVLDIRAIDLPDSSIGTLICTEVLEHVDRPFEAMKEIFRVLKDDGLLVLTAPMNLEIHGSPFDYWRFTSQGFEVLLEDFQFKKISFGGKENFPDTIVALASKSKSIDVAAVNVVFNDWEGTWKKERKSIRGLVILKNLMVPRIFLGSNYEFLLRKNLSGFSYIKSIVTLLIPNVLSLSYWVNRLRK
jgi:SAM-dependent methyltransferase